MAGASGLAAGSDDPKRRHVEPRRIAHGLLGGLLLAVGVSVPTFANDAPTLSIHIGGNRTFVWDREPVRYIVVASDSEDGDSLAGSINPYTVAVEFRYVEGNIDGFEPAAAPAEVVIGATRGKALVEGDDCLLCHTERANGPTAIPTYAAIAAKFDGNLSVAPALAYNIVNGSEGVWGTMLMPAHAGISMPDATAMALYVLSLADAEPAREYLPITGVVTPAIAMHLRDGPFGATMAGRLVLSASYTDLGGAAEPPQTGSATVSLRHANVMATEFDSVDGFGPATLDGMSLLASGEGASNAVLEGVDLSGIRTISLLSVGSARRWPGGTVELRADAPDGERIGTFRVAHDSDGNQIERTAIRIGPQHGIHDLYLVASGDASVAIGAICFECSF